MIYFGLGIVFLIASFFGYMFIGSYFALRSVKKVERSMRLLADQHKGKNFIVKVDYSKFPPTFTTNLSGRWNPHYVSKPDTAKEKEVEIHLLVLKGVTTSEKALKRIKKAGFRPAETRELLAFREQYPFANLDHTIAFLGTVYQSKGEGGIAGAQGVFSHMVSAFARVAYIPQGYFEKEEHFFTTSYEYSPWFPGCIPWDSNTRFAAVKLKNR